MVDGVVKQYELTRTWDVLNDIISSNITDPAIPKRYKSSDWIKNGFPNPGYLDKKDPKGWRFPLVIISIPNIEEDIVVCDDSVSRFTHSVSISCYATTRLQAAQLAEEIAHIFRGTGRADLNLAKLYVPNINGTSEDSDFIGTVKYYVKTVDYEFVRYD